MARRQVRKALREHLHSAIEALGFEPGKHKDRWTQKRGDATCEIAIWFTGPGATSRGWEFQVYVGVNHAAGSASSNQIGGRLTQTDVRAQPLFADTWSAEDFSPTEAAQDAAHSVRSQASSFVESWSDPKFTFAELKRRAALPPPSQDEPDRSLGAPRLLVAHNDLWFLSELARYLGDDEEERRLLTEFRERAGGRIHLVGLEYRLAELEGSTFVPPAPPVTLTPDPAVRRKINLQIREKVVPFLESHGFERTDAKYQYGKMQNKVECGVYFRALPTLADWPSDSPLGEGSIAISVGVGYLPLQLGHEETIAQLENPGFAGTLLRIDLTRTRSTNCVGPIEIWDPAQLTVDGVIDDALAAFESQALPFFERWIDLEWAWRQLSVETPPDIDLEAKPQLGEPGPGGFFGTFDSWARIETLMSLAAQLNYVDEEIELLHRLAARWERHGGLGELHSARLKLLEEQRGT